MRYLIRPSVLGTRLATVLKDRPVPQEVRFTIQGHLEEFVVRAGMPGSVLVRRPRQRRGEYVDWDASSFRGLDPELVLEQLKERIRRVEGPGIACASWEEFLGWLERQELEDPRHAYLIKLPATLFEALRVRALEEKTTVRDLIARILARAM
jgi:hypothetical protein